ncbi:ABC transporter permease [candidate division KSB1 bacterium]|nr:ABC transporter permease [candidate division KSB1 bacterium]
MIKNYLITAVRNITKHRGYSLINILGLAIGMACCILILLWVLDELSYDRFHSRSKQLYRLVSEDYSGGEVMKSAGSPAPIGPALLNTCPDVVDFTRLQSGWSGWYLHYGEKNFMTERLACADPSFFDMFDYTFIHGDGKTALKERYSVVLTERLARKCFGDENPVGKVMQMHNQDMTVTGVIADPPRNSHIQFDYIFPIINMTQWRESQIESWKYTQFATYIELSPKSDPDRVDAQITKLVKSNLPDAKVKVHLQPLRDIHLHSKEMNSWMIVYPNPGDIQYIYIFTLIALCILILACINYMNIATARASTRAREIGVRKVTGAVQKDLLMQFMGESLFITSMAFILAILLVEILLPLFSALTGKTYSHVLFLQADIILLSGAVILFTALLAGGYPALYFAAFRPVEIFKSMAPRSLQRGGGVRRWLVVGQFAFTTILIVLTLTMYRQIYYIQTKDLGFNPENIIHFAGYGEYRGNYQATKNELLQNPDIIGVCNAFPPSFGLRSTTEVSWEGKDSNHELLMHSDIGDYDFKEIFNLRMAAGRYYSRQYGSDTANFVVNETAIKAMALKNPIGKRFTFRGKTGAIIGVVKDYHGGSLREPIQPKVIELSQQGFFIIVKYRSGSQAGVLRFLEQRWKKFVPGYPFRYRFLDEEIAGRYDNDRRIGKIFTYASILAIFIACLGLFGMASFMAERRTKEIGIRKVLGASANGLLTLLSKDFIKWVFIANVIAWPIAYFIANKWLQGFAYRVSLGWGVFLLALVLALLISMATVAYQAIRVAGENPVRALRYE